MTRGETNLIPINLEVRRKISLNLGTYHETMQEYLYKTDRDRQKCASCVICVVRMCMENVCKF